MFLLAGDEICFLADVDVCVSWNIGRKPDMSGRGIALLMGVRCERFFTVPVKGEGIFLWVVVYEHNSLWVVVC